MLALRYAYLLALVVWLGGIVVLGALVAPTTFAVLQTQAPSGGRALAGDVFGQIIARFHVVEYGTGTLLVVTLAAMRLLGPRPAAFAARAAIAAAMLAAAVYSGVIVLGEIEALQGGLGARFDELHQLSTRLMLARMAGALVLLYWEARET